MNVCRHLQQAHNHSRANRIVRLAGLSVWVTVLTYLSLVPSSAVPSALPDWDKLNHFAAYAVLAWLLLWTLTAWHAPSVRLLTWSWIACSAFGLCLEVLQGTMAFGRQFEGGDLLANAIGALSACVLFRHIMQRYFTHDR
jgi:VanZ family protein